jgi:putative solute:sodium symporter small subunit
MNEPQKIQAHWRETTRLTVIMLGIWAFFAFFVHFLAPGLNKIHVLGFPLGFYIAAQGSLIVFVVQLFWFAKAQDAVDRKYGMAEDE